MKKVCLLLCLFTALLSAERITFSESEYGTAVLSTDYSGPFSVTFDLTVPAIQTKKEIVDGVVYTRIKVNGLNSVTDIGKPAVPVYNTHMIVPEGAECKVTVLEKKSVTLSDITVYPALEPHLDSDEFPFDKEPAFIKDNSVYGKDACYPGAQARVIEYWHFRGTPIATVQICPVNYNPQKKRVEVYTRLKVRIEFTGGTTGKIARGKSATILKNTCINGSRYMRYAGETRARSMRADYKYDMIVITTPTFIDPVNALVTWQRQKGYEVLVESREDWDSLTIKSLVKEFYDTNDKPGYMLIFGDADDVPGTCPAKGGSGEENFMSDINYVLVGSTYYWPEMATGRISVSTAEEGWNAVNKIIRYERDPIDDEAFYNSYLFCAEFQDDNNDGYADRRFAQTAWELFCYLGDTLGYDVEKIFAVRKPEINPQYWNNGEYSFGQPVPEVLKRPNCSWDGDSTDIFNSINNGKHIVMHRDHGMELGWGTPKFRVNHVEQLNNGVKTPVVLSLNCLTGTYKHDDCFAEALIKKEDGAVGVLAASRSSWSGANDAYAHGLIDAIWPDPGTYMTCPAHPDPEIEDHEPIYTVGDIMMHGNLRMKACWGNLIDYYKLFHWFGDPTMEARTCNPKSMTASFYNLIHPGAVDFEISKLNIPNGYATLYSKGSDSIVGKVEITGTEATIALTAALILDDTLVLTITSHDYRPVHKDIPVSTGQTKFVNLATGDNHANKLYVNGRRFLLPGNKNVGVKVFAVNGRQILSRQWNTVSKDIKIDIPEMSTGVYLVRIQCGKKEKVENVFYVKR